MKKETLHGAPRPGQALADHTRRERFTGRASPDPGGADPAEVGPPKPRRELPTADRKRRFREDEEAR